MNLPNNSSDNIKIANNIAKTLRPRMILLPWLMYTAVIFGIYNWVLYSAVGLIFFICIYGVVAILNDLADKEIDKDNNRDVPYANGQIKKSQLINVLATLVVIIFTISTFINSWFLFFAGLYMLLGYIYSYGPSLKNKHWWGVILLSVCYGLLPWFLGMTVSSTMYIEVYYIAAFSSLIFCLGTVPLKDFKDRKGDELHGKTTVLVKYGYKYVKMNFITYTSLAYLILVLYLIYLGLGVAWIIAIFSFALIFITYPRINLTDKNNRVYYGNLYRTTYYLLLIGTVIYMAN